MSLWVPVVAALGASLLTMAGAFGLEVYRQRAAARAASVQRRRVAYATLIEAAHATLTLGQAMRSVVKAQSGLDASVSLMVRARKPVDPFEVALRLAGEVTPLLNAQAGVLSCGTPQAAGAARDVAARATEYLQAATVMTSTQRALRGVISWRPTSEQERGFDESLSRAGRAIEAFVTIMRDELGEEAMSVSPAGPQAA
jgi:hypothetical protein